jgi:pimeloyl-ACP methyl ester carboxylesterase
MVRHGSLFLHVAAAALVLFSTSVSGESGVPEHGFPEARTEAYRDAAGQARIYRVQEPGDLKQSPDILIYMHGSAGKEEQGMDPEWASGTFSRLRTLMAEWGWVYVCPRDVEFKGLLKHLGEKYKPGNIYLSGASGGGNAAIWEAAKNPSSFAGLLLLGPAVGRRRPSFPGNLAMPVWIVSGERDRQVTKQCRILVRKLEALKSPHFYREIEGGHHGSPVEKVDWRKALEFLREERRDFIAGLSTDSDVSEDSALSRKAPR